MGKRPSEVGTDTQESSGLPGCFLNFFLHPYIMYKGFAEIVASGLVACQLLI